MTAPYDAPLRSLARRVAADAGINLREGVYAYVAGLFRDPGRATVPADRRRRRGGHVHRTGSCRGLTCGDSRPYLDRRQSGPARSAAGDDVESRKCWRWGCGPPRLIIVVRGVLGAV